MTRNIRLVGCHDAVKACAGGSCELIAENLTLKEAQELYKVNKSRFAVGCWPESMR